MLGEDEIKMLLPIEMKRREVSKEETRQRWLAQQQASSSNMHCANKKSVERWCTRMQAGVISLYRFHFLVPDKETHTH